MASLGQSRGAPASRRNSAPNLTVSPTPPPSQPPPPRTNLVAPEDDYDYSDAGPSISPTNPKQRSGDPSIADVSDDPERFADELRTNIYEKAISGNRAKLPDDLVRTNGTVAASTSPPTVPAGSSAPSRRKKRDLFSTPRSPATGRVPRSAEKTTLRKVELQLSQEEVEGVTKVSLNASIPNNDVSAGLENSVLWQHSKYDNIRLEELEDLLVNLQIHGLQESEIGLTKRLIKRIGLVSERSFVNGRFLIPTAIRYDMLDDSRYNKDRCSIFLGFPYFATKKPDEKPSIFGKGAPEHPSRTLLQSRYRLNKTTKRDESQCIKVLRGEELKSCIKAPHSDTAHLTHRKVEELIYVPQLWTLIIGLDRMITAGPIGDVPLLGSNLTLKDTSASGAPRQCLFVRISFINRGAVESQIYPIDQCKSWFGLLNIHQQLRKVFKQGKEKACPKDFKLSIRGHTLTGSTWASVQRLNETEVLSIWMDTPQPPPPAVSIRDADGEPISEQQDPQDTDTPAVHKTTPTGTATNKIYQELDPVPVNRPFLEWLILDDFGIRDESAPEVKINRFLSTIYHSLAAICASPNVVSPSHVAQSLQKRQTANHAQTTSTGKTTVAAHNRETVSPTLCRGSTGASGQITSPGDASQSSQSTQAAQKVPSQTSGSGRSKIVLTGRTSKDVDDLTYKLQQQADGNGTIIEQYLRKEAARLFSYYVSISHHERFDGLASVRLFWALLYELIEHGQHLQSLHQQIQDINNWAKRLHLGVYHERRILSDNGDESFESAISDRAILQATMIDALGAIFNMLVAAVREARSGHSTDPNVEPWQRALTHGKEACDLLTEARNKLIAEAISSAPGENLGPVVTPEAIMITLLERLAHGVYGSGTVDVINIHEECLEQLALDVEKRPSRRLLKRINAFQEEVDIINNVLIQQHQVLLEFRTCLDPAEFKRPTTARRMRFKFEKSGIERILTHINDQRRYCRELCDRAKVLENQNVRLVETLADDNSRVVFIFTFITILFLPLSFVATFFGMNVEGINPTTSTTSHFWLIGATLTGGIMLICMVFVFRGEVVWFFLADLPANCVQFFELRKKEKIS